MDAQEAMARVFEDVKRMTPEEFAAELKKYEHHDVTLALRGMEAVLHLRQGEENEKAGES